MNVFRMVRLDLKIGVWKKVRFGIFAVLCILCGSLFVEVAPDYLDIIEEGTLSLADFLAFIWQGIFPMIRAASGEEFQLPPIWLMLMLMICLMPLDYPARSTELWGSQYLLRVNRRCWWMSKCIYTLLVNTLTFVIFLIVMVLLCCMAHIPLVMTNNPEFYSMLFGTVNFGFTASLSAMQNVCLLIVMPLAGIYAISLLQLFLAIWLHPMIAYLVTVVILGYSVYDIKPWLLGNQTMAIRSIWIDPAGLRPDESLIWCVSIGAAVVIAGFILIRRKDVIVPKKEEM